MGLLLENRLTQQLGQSGPFSPIDQQINILVSADRFSCQRIQRPPTVEQCTHAVGVEKIQQIPDLLHRYFCLLRHDSPLLFAGIVRKASCRLPGRSRNI
jgi:hypothetical protein